MPRVHDKYNKYCPQNWIAPFDEANCVCHPTIQHEGHCDGECNHDWCEGKDPEAVCPQEKQDWEAWFDEKFPIAIDYPPFPNKVQETGVFFEIEIEQRTNRAKAKHEAIKDFIRKEKALSKEEGRREGYEDGKALRGKEWKQDIEEVRLEVIGAVEDYVRRYYVLHKNDGKPLIEKADILALLDSLKNNSKL